MRGQRAAVLDFLKTYGSITSRQAIDNFGATRLADIIFNFRKMGMDIETKMMAGKNRFGEACQYAKYILHEEEQ